MLSQACSHLRRGISNQALQARLKGSVWSLCRSWYRAENGRIVALFPGFTREYVRSVNRPDLRDYRFG